MREIKFRAWSPIHAKMIATIANQHTAMEWFLNPQSSYEVMQYTGLQDMNGVDIYEGDVLRAKGYYTDMFVVEYFDFGFGLADGKNGVLCADDARAEDIEEMEIIGNIYENPELLEPK